MLSKHIASVSIASFAETAVSANTPAGTWQTAFGECQDSLARIWQEIPTVVD
jgi:hypothetical protein